MAGVADLVTVAEVAELTAIAALDDDLASADEAGRAILRKFLMDWKGYAPSADAQSLYEQQTKPNQATLAKQLGQIKGSNP